MTSRVMLAIFNSALQTKYVRRVKYMYNVIDFYLGSTGVRAFGTGVDLSVSIRAREAILVNLAAAGLRLGTVTSR